MKLEIGKIVGVPTERGWSQVHFFLPEEEEKWKKRGQFFAVLAIWEIEKGIEIASAGREVIARLHEEYYGELTESPFSRLKESIKRVFLEVKEEAKIEIVAGAVVSDVLYLAVLGEGKVILKRKGKLFEILKGEGEGIIRTVSGYLQEGDVILLGTKRFFEITGMEVIRSALGASSIQEIEEILSPFVVGREEVATAMIIKNKGDEFILEEGISKKTLIEEKLRKFVFNLRQRLTRRSQEKSKKTLFTVGIILLLLLGISVFFGAKEKKRREREEKIRIILQQVEEKKKEGEEFLGVNPLRARGILKEAERLLKEIEKEKNVPAEVKKIKEELESSLNSLIGEYQVEEKVFFDLELIKKGAVGNDFALIGDNLVVLDSQNATIYEIGIGDKKSTIIAGGKELQGAIFISGEEKIFVFTEEGIFQVKGNALLLVVAKDKEWQTIKDFQVFAGNLYLLDREEIWVYSSGEGGYGNKKRWLKEEGSFSLGKAMAINGAIWILQGEQIEKYLRGKKDVFKMEGLEIPLSQPEDLFTTSKEERIYILDKGNSRILVLNKNGEYFAQYLSPPIKEAKKIVVSEEKGKIFLLKGSKIFQIDLR